MGIIIPFMGMKKTSLTNVLFSKVQQRVLAILYVQPNYSFHTNDIIRLSRSGTGATQRELKKLASAKLITVKQKGNLKLYQANPDTPIFSELRSIVLKTFGLADVLQEALISMASKIDVSFIYGSIAKQEDTASSDIDLMIITNQLTYPGLFKQLEKIEPQLGRHINPTIYTPTEWIQKQKANNNFILQIMRQPKIFLIGNEDELTILR